MDYGKLCKSWGRLLKVEVGWKERDQLKAGLDFLDIQTTPEDTQGFANLVGLAGAAGSVLLIAVLSLLIGFSFLWLLFAGFPAVLYLYLKKYPVLKAESEKKKALSQLPETMSYLIMSLRINPNLERSIEFAARHSHGLLKKKLEGIISNVRAGRSNTESDILRLADDFKKWDEFKRSVQLVISSTLERTEEKRQNTLDKANEVLLGGLSVRTEREARALNTPVMIVFTFGVILPLVFVAIIPFMSLMGIRIGTITIAVMYTIGLPLLLFVLIRFISSNRPATISPPNVPAESKTGLAFIVAGVAAAGFTSLVFLGEKTLGAMEFIPFLWAAGAGIGLFLLMTTRETKKLRKTTKGLEKGFAEKLHELGVVLSEGRPLEDSMSRIDSHFFRNAAGNIRALNTDLRSAFFDGRFGSLREVYSDTIKGVVEILVSISNKGSEAIAAVSFRMSEHISNLKKSEMEIERSLGSVVSSMKIIAMVVAPLVGGMISSMSIVLADTMEKTKGANMGMGGKAIEPLDPSLITLIIGIYAMESAAILVMFGNDLMNGGDRVMRKRAIGIALPVAVLVFTVCAWLANGLFGGIS